MMTVRPSIAALAPALCRLADPTDASQLVCSTVLARGGRCGMARLCDKRLRSPSGRGIGNRETSHEAAGAAHRGKSIRSASRQPGWGLSCIDRHVTNGAVPAGGRRNGRRRHARHVPAAQRVVIRAGASRFGGRPVAGSRRPAVAAHGNLARTAKPHFRLVRTGRARTIAARPHGGSIGHDHHRTEPSDGAKYRIPPKRSVGWDVCDNGKQRGNISTSRSA